jgi:peptidyl-prolyl cis-trans isomerase B (cyclophilin B)
VKIPQVLAAGLLLAGCATAAPVTPTFNGSTTTCTYQVSGDSVRPVDPPNGTGVPTVGVATFVLKMSAGNVTITMNRPGAPCTIHSFENLAKQGFYDNTACHRLATSGFFMLQCGDPTGTGRGGPGYRYADELNPPPVYPAGTVAMANAGPDTNGSQFFLVFEDSQLPPAYTAFGTVDAASLEVLRTIARAGSDGGNPDGTGRPNMPATIVEVIGG